MPRSILGTPCAPSGVQEGLARHAFNARTGEVRYAFSPQDFGLVTTTTAVPDTRDDLADIPHIDDDTEEETLPVILTYSGLASARPTNISDFSPL